MTLEITEEEREELVRLLEHCMSETRVEHRHTRNPEWRQRLREEEDLLEGLLSRLRAMSSHEAQAVS